MPTQVQFRRGTTAQNNSFTGAAGELSINTSNSTIRVHDGSTPGGFELAKLSDVTTAVADLIDAAPGALNTLNELAAAINDDNNFATTIVTQLSNKANIASLTTANVTEVTNLYFTNARVYSNVISIGYATNANVLLKANLTDKLSVFASTLSSELAGVISDETGSGALVFATNPTLVTPILGTPQSGTLTNTTGLPLSTGVTGTLPVANGGTGTASPAIVAGTGIGVSGSFPNQTIQLQSTSVTAATYGNASFIPSITVDAQGRITAASNVAVTPGVTTGKSIAMAIVFGG